MSDLKQYALDVATRARQVSFELAKLSSAKKNQALLTLAKLLEEERDLIQAENKKDLEAGKKAGLSGALLDRLSLNEKRIQEMIKGLKEVAALPDPVGGVIEGWTRPNGLNIQKVRVPIGVVFAIFESRPNVTVDVGALTLKSGNAAILRGGKEALHSNLILGELFGRALRDTGISPAAVQVIEKTDHALTDILLTLSDKIDLVTPRGGKALIQAVTEKAKMPVIKHFEGICHVFLDQSADYQMAEEITLNAKCQRPATCNALETLLVHEAHKERFLPRLLVALQEKGVRLKGCKKLLAAADKVNVRAESAGEAEWRTEYLDLILNVRVVGNLSEAIDHINTYGSGHSDAIVTKDFANAERFLQEVNSAAVYVNASTRFTDGGEFGLGAEVGISTDKLHARGPMGLTELTTYKWVIRGSGQTRT